MPDSAKSKRAAEDAGLAVRARAGDEAAFEELVRRYQRPIYDYCRRLVGNETTAEDLAQESFVKLYFGLNAYDPAKPVSPYVYRIAHNHCLDWLRKRKLATVPLAWEDDETGEEVVWDIPDASLAPDEKFARGELARAVDEALASMPAVYRGALILRYREGMSYEEIATTLALPVGTVKAQISRGRVKLQHKLKAYV